MISPVADKRQSPERPQPTLQRTVTFCETLSPEETTLTSHSSLYADAIPPWHSNSYEDKVELGIIKKVAATSSDKPEDVDRDDGRLWGIRIRTVIIVSITCALILGGLLGGIAGGMLVQNSMAKEVDPAIGSAAITSG